MRTPIHWNSRQAVRTQRTKLGSKRSFPVRDRTSLKAGMRMISPSKAAGVDNCSVMVGSGGGVVESWSVVLGLNCEFDRLSGLNEYVLNPCKDGWSRVAGIAIPNGCSESGRSRIVQKCEVRIHSLKSVERNRGCVSLEMCPGEPAAVFESVLPDGVGGCGDRQDAVEPAAALKSGGPDLRKVRRQGKVSGESAASRECKIVNYG